MQPLEQNHHPSCLVRKNIFIYFWHFHFKGNLQPRSARLIAVFYVSQSYIDIFWWGQSNSHGLYWYNFSHIKWSYHILPINNNCITLIESLHMTYDSSYDAVRLIFPYSQYFSLQKCPCCTRLGPCIWVALATCVKICTTFSSKSSSQDDPLTSWIWGFRKWGYPQMDGLQWNIPFFRDDLGYPYFRNPHLCEEQWWKVKAPCRIPGKMWPFFQWTKKTRPQWDGPSSMSEFWRFFLGLHFRLVVLVGTRAGHNNAVLDLLFHFFCKHHYWPRFVAICYNNTSKPKQRQTKDNHANTITTINALRCNITIHPKPST